MGEIQKTGVGSPETQKHDEQLEQLVDARSESIRDKLDKAEREHREKHSHSEALQEAQNLAHESAANAHSNEHTQTSPAERRRGPITKKQLSNSFNSQMNHVQEHLSPTSRAFSKVIHNKTVEKVSDGVGKTLARPNALLSGSIAAFLCVTLLYFVAKYYGFQLSGFETIGAFVFGWILGLIYDYASLMLRNR